jgi:hypothetical protein
VALNVHGFKIGAGGILAFFGIGAISAAIAVPDRNIPKTDQMVAGNNDRQRSDVCIIRPSATLIHILALNALPNFNDH